MIRINKQKVHLTLHAIQLYTGEHHCLDSRWVQLAQVKIPLEVTKCTHDANFCFISEPSVGASELLHSLCAVISKVREYIYRTNGCRFPIFLLLKSARERIKYKKQLRSTHPKFVNSNWGFYFSHFTNQEITSKNLQSLIHELKRDFRFYMCTCARTKTVDVILLLGSYLINAVKFARSTI